VAVCFLNKDLSGKCYSTWKLCNLTLSFGRDIPISMYDLLFLTPKPIIVIGYFRNGTCTSEAVGGPWCNITHEKQLTGNEISSKK
jgi:hypothetical protein